MLPYINIFGIALPVAELSLLLGVYFGAGLAERYAHLHKVDANKLYNLVFVAVVAGVIGARLSYAAQHPTAFIETPRNLLSTNQGLLDPLGGLLIALLASYIYGQRNNMSLWPTLDSLSPALATLMLAIPIANIGSGDGYGAPANLPWSIDLWGTLRHPSQFYEIIAAGLVLWLIWPTRQSEKQPAGLQFMLFIAATAFTKLFLEGFRGDSAIFLQIRTTQLLAFAILAAALWGITKLNYENETR